MGFESGTRLAAAGARVVVTARTQAKADRAAAAISAANPGGSAVGVLLNMASLESVRTFPERLSAAIGADSAIDVLINNAQGDSPFNSEQQRTPDGFDQTVGIGHLAHFALVAALVPYLRRARDGFRVISVSNDVHRTVLYGTFYAALESDLRVRDEVQFERFRISKVANVLFTAELARRIRESTGLLHGGSAVVVGMHDPRLDLTVPLAPSANAIVWLAAAADTDGNRARSEHLYYNGLTRSVAAPSAVATDERLARKASDPPTASHDPHATRGPQPASWLCSQPLSLRLPNSQPAASLLRPPASLHRAVRRAI